MPPPDTLQSQDNLVAGFLLTHERPEGQILQLGLGQEPYWVAVSDLRQRWEAGKYCLPGVACNLHRGAGISQLLAAARSLKIPLSRAPNLKSGCRMWPHVQSHLLHICKFKLASCLPRRQLPVMPAVPFKHKHRQGTNNKHAQECV